MSKYIKKGRWVYAMYKGDECLAIGTSDEICKQMGIKKSWFYFMRSQAYLESVKESKKKNHRIIVRIDNEVEE